MFDTSAQFVSRTLLDALCIALVDRTKSADTAADLMRSSSDPELQRKRPTDNKSNNVSVKGLVLP